MTSLELNEIVRGDPLARSSYNDMAFSIDAGRVASIVYEVGNCVVTGVTTESQTEAISNDIAVVSRGYGLKTELVDVSDGVYDESVVDKVDTFLADITSRDSGLLIVSGLNKLVSTTGKSEGARGAFLQRIVKLVGDPSRSAVCAVNIGKTDTLILPGRFWSGFERTYEFRGFIQPVDAVSILNEYYALGDALKIVHRLHVNENLTYDEIDALTRNPNVLADQA